MEAKKSQMRAVEDSVDDEVIDELKERLHSGMASKNVYALIYRVYAGLGVEDYDLADVADRILEVIDENADVFEVTGEKYDNAIEMAKQAQRLEKSVIKELVEDA